MIASKDIRNNKVKSIIIYTLKTTTLMCASGTLIQTFLSVLGFESRQIYIHSTLLQLATVLSIMLGSRWADKGNIIKRSAFIFIPGGLLFLLYIPACIVNEASIEMYVFLLVISVIHAIINGLSTVCEYKLPYYIYQKDDYGQVLAVGGVLSGIVSLAIGMMISTLTKTFSYVNIMFVAFLISTLFMIISSVIGLYYKSLVVEENNKENTQEDNEIKISLVQIFKHKTFYKLFCPNLLRGISAGILSVMAAVAIDIGFDEGVTATMVSVQSAATLISCALFALYAKKISSKKIILIGSITFFLLPMMIIKNNISFLTIYGVVFLGRILVDYAVPDMLFKIVPLEIAGPYHAWRMVLNNGGMVLGTVIASILPTTVLLVFAAISQLISGVMYVTTKIEGR